MKKPTAGVPPNEARPGVDRRNRILRANLLLLAISMGLTLIVGEVMARAFLSAPLPWRYPQVRYRSDPMLDFVLSPNQRAYTADKPVRINSRGLRGPELDYARTPGLLRLLFLGDSIIFGYGVTEQEVVAHRVEVLLRARGIAAEGINTGVPSYNTEQEVSFLAQEGMRYRADWVILGFCWNDINDQLGVRVSPEGWLVSRTAADPQSQSLLLESSTGYAIRNLMKRSRLAYGALEGARALQEIVRPDSHTLFRADVLEGRETEQVRAGWKRVTEAIHRLRLLGSEEGFRSLIVAFPAPLVFERAFPRSSYPARLRDIASTEGIPFLDLEPVFRKEFQGHDSLFIPYDGDHPNAAGHELAAREIVRFLLLLDAAPPEAQHKDSLFGTH